ncbi:carboxymuconolactone decarboxylase family protein [Thermincola ferriacetica]
MPVDTLKKLEENQKKIAGMLPDLMANFKKVHDAALAEGALTSREKVLIGLGIAVSKQCSYCISKYLKSAIDMNIELQEIIEACGVAILMNGGPGAAYTSFVLDTYAELKKQIGR